MTPWQIQRSRRDQEWVDLFRAGWTQSDIAGEYETSRQRVQQVLKRNGVDGGAGGQAAQSRQREQAKRAAADARAQRAYGCTRAMAEFLNGGLPLRHTDGLALAYQQHRANVRNLELYRDTTWGFTFPTWVETWLTSGHLDERGRSAGGFVMSLIDRRAPWAPGNVEVITLSEASQRGQHRRRHPDLTSLSGYGSLGSTGSG